MILAFGGAGYTELSRDVIEGRRIGEVVRSGLDWLVSKQDKEGAFDRTPAAGQALASLALLETYGLTGRRKEPAERAFGWLEKAALSEVIGRVRQARGIQSAKLAELGTGHDARLLELAEGLDRQAGELAKAGSMMVRGFAWPRGTKKPEVDYGILDPLRVSPEALNVFVDASCMMEGGERWHEWYASLRKRLEPLQRSEENGCESGSWDGESLRERVRVTAIRCLTLAHYRCFHCRNVFRPQKK